MASLLSPHVVSLARPRTVLFSIRFGASGTCTTRATMMPGVCTCAASIPPVFKSEMKDMGSDGDKTDAAKAAAPQPPAAAAAPQQLAAAPVPTPPVSPHPQYVQAG